MTSCSTSDVAALAMAASLGLVACGGGVQKAEIVPVAGARAPSPAPPSMTANLAPRYVLRADRSRFWVVGSDILTGSHRLTFKRWTAHVSTSPSLVVHLDVDTTSVEAAAPFLTQIAREELLEATSFPRSVLEGDLRVVDERAGIVEVDATLDLHGVQRGLRFRGTLVRKGDAFRFRAEVAIARSAFGIHARPAWDRFIDDDVRIFVDAVATPERVTAEPVEDTAPAR